MKACPLTDWQAPRSVADLVADYELRAPSPGPSHSPDGPGGLHRLGLLYLTAIARHFADRPAAPPCTLATVYATLLHQGPARVLSLLRADPAAADLLRPLLASPAALTLHTPRALCSQRLTLLPLAALLPGTATTLVGAYFEARPLSHLLLNGSKRSHLQPTAYQVHA